MTATFSKKLNERLRDEMVIWLTTVREDGMPQPTPVWFVWDGETFLIFSQPDTRKLRNIAHNPRAALNLNSDRVGDEVAVITGEAWIEREALPANRVPAYLTKYNEGIAQIGMTPKSFADEYSVAIRVRPGHVREE
jgi:PPOX class probable F420-dependent enzyme